MASPGNADRQLWLLVVTIVCGVAGGLLAGRFLHVDVWMWLGGAAVATAVAFGLLTRDTPAPRVRPRPQVAPDLRPAAPPAWHQQTASRSRPAPTSSPPPSPPGHVVLPLPGEAAGPRQWWTETNTATNTEANTATERNSRPSQLPDLPSYVAKGAVLVAQCPNCGDFRIDVRGGGSAFAFRCRNPRCGHEWQWTPGTPWPPVVVRRNLTGEPSHDR
ncbi:hypothetical protein [Actinophytocola sp.]|uniref:hypothetical protein n=1 Tax=Actinophytocola sp. TaxID=1872138 RepID=UPI002EDA46A3